MNTIQAIEYSANKRISGYRITAFLVIFSVVIIFLSKNFLKEKGFNIHDINYLILCFAMYLVLCLVGIENTYRILKKR